MDVMLVESNGSINRLSLLHEDNNDRPGPPLLPSTIKPLSNLKPQQQHPASAIRIISAQASFHLHSLTIATNPINRRGRLLNSSSMPGDAGSLVVGLSLPQSERE